MEQQDIYLNITDNENWKDDLRVFIENELLDIPYLGNKKLYCLHYNIYNKENKIYFSTNDWSSDDLLNDISFEDENGDITDCSIDDFIKKINNLLYINNK